MKTVERDFLLGKIAGDQESIFRELKEMKDNDLKSIDNHLGALNDNVAKNTERSIKNATFIKIMILALKIGVPVGVGAVITYCKGLW